MLRHRRPSNTAAAPTGAQLIAAFEAFDREPESPLSEEKVARVVDPVVTFLRAGLDALKTPSEKARDSQP